MPLSCELLLVRANEKEGVRIFAALCKRELRQAFENVRPE